VLNEGVLLLLRKRPGWDDALGSLQGLYQSHGDGANTRAAEYASLYREHRAAMVFDAVASRQRRYVPRVLPLVAAFQQTPAAASLSSLAKLGPSNVSLVTGEGETMRDVAAGLLRFGADSGHGTDDAAVEAWATSVAPLEFAPALDPYVGAVKGIGIALFCYLRMRAGADALKPDVRVRKALGRLGFDIPDGEAALLVTASALAEELAVSRLVLDQLLWWAEGT
jgi:hypothetical protein